MAYKSIEQQRNLQESFDRKVKDLSVSESV